MTNEAKVRWVAEHVMGWTRRPDCRHFPTDDLWDVDPERGICRNSMTFKPLESIADAFEAQAKLDAEQKEAFVAELLREVTPKHMSRRNVTAAILATPAQRCNALIRATGGNPDE